MNQSNLTQIQLANQSTQDVVAYITLGATPGCVQDVSQLTFSDTSIKVTALAPLQGYFTLKANSSSYIKAPGTDGFNGNFSFSTPPLNCPTPDFPNGVNLAEFIINNGFQQGSPQETLDISCVAGVNAKIKFAVSADNWSTNGGAIAVSSFENQTGANTGLVGVYPYGCDNCTASVAPPSCVGKQPKNANKEPICNVQRDAKSNAGGTVEVIYLGPL